MIIEIEFQDISEFKNGFPNYWLNTMFDGSISPERKINALITTYIRLVESALVDYQLAVSELKEFWKPSSSLKLRTMHSSISHFETCITNMHRAIKCLKAIRSSPELPESLKDLFAERPKFVQDKIANRIREIRDAIHHIETRFNDETEIEIDVDTELEATIKPKGKSTKRNISDGEPIMIKPEGLEIPVDDDPGQTLKKINELQIGSLKISALELTEWLLEIASVAKKISDYRLPSAPKENFLRSLFGG